MEHFQAPLVFPVPLCTRFGPVPHQDAVIMTSWSEDATSRDHRARLYCPPTDLKTQQVSHLPALHHLYPISMDMHFRQFPDFKAFETSCQQLAAFRKQFSSSSSSAESKNPSSSSSSSSSASSSSPTPRVLRTDIDTQWTNSLRGYTSMETDASTYEQCCLGQQPGMPADDGYVKGSVFGIHGNNLSHIRDFMAHCMRGESHDSKTNASVFAAVLHLITLVCLQAYAHVHRRYLAYHPSKAQREGPYDHSQPPYLMMLFLRRDFRRTLCPAKIETRERVTRSSSSSATSGHATEQANGPEGMDTSAGEDDDESELSTTTTTTDAQTEGVWKGTLTLPIYSQDKLLEACKSLSFTDFVYVTLMAVMPERRMDIIKWCCDQLSKDIWLTLGTMRFREMPVKRLATHFDSVTSQAYGSSKARTSHKLIHWEKKRQENSFHVSRLILPSESKNPWSALVPTFMGHLFVDPYNPVLQCDFPRIASNAPGRLQKVRLHHAAHVLLVYSGNTKEVDIKKWFRVSSPSPSSPAKSKPKTKKPKPSPRKRPKTTSGKDAKQPREGEEEEDEQHQTKESDEAEGGDDELEPEETRERKVAKKRKTPPSAADNDQDTQVVTVVKTTTAMGLMNDEEAMPVLSPIRRRYSMTEDGGKLYNAPPATCYTTHPLREGVCWEDERSLMHVDRRTWRVLVEESTCTLHSHVCKAVAVWQQHLKASETENKERLKLLVPIGTPEAFRVDAFVGDPPDDMPVWDAWSIPVIGTKDTELIRIWVRYDRPRTLTKWQKDWFQAVFDPAVGDPHAFDDRTRPYRMYLLYSCLLRKEVDIMASVVEQLRLERPDYEQLKLDSAHALYALQSSLRYYTADVESHLADADLVTPGVRLALETRITQTWNRLSGVPLAVDQPWWGLISPNMIQHAIQMRQRDNQTVFLTAAAAVDTEDGKNNNNNNGGGDGAGGDPVNDPTNGFRELWKYLEAVGVPSNKYPSIWPPVPAKVQMQVVGEVKFEQKVSAQEYFEMWATGLYDSVCIPLLLYLSLKCPIPVIRHQTGVQDDVPVVFSKVSQGPVQVPLHALLSNIGTKAQAAFRRFARRRDVNAIGDLSTHMRNVAFLDPAMVPVYVLCYSLLPEAMRTPHLRDHVSAVSGYRLPGTPAGVSASSHHQGNSGAGDSKQPPAHCTPPPLMVAGGSYKRLQSTECLMVMVQFLRDTRVFWQCYNLILMDLACLRPMRITPFVIKTAWTQLAQDPELPFGSVVTTPLWRLGVIISILWMACPIRTERQLLCACLDTTSKATQVCKDADFEPHWKLFQKMLETRSGHFRRIEDSKRHPNETQWSRESIEALYRVAVLSAPTDASVPVISLPAASAGSSSSSSRAI